LARDSFSRRESGTACAPHLCRCTLPLHSSGLAGICKNRHGVVQSWAVQSTERTVGLRYPARFHLSQAPGRNQPERFVTDSSEKTAGRRRGLLRGGCGRLKSCATSSIATNEQNRGAGEKTQYPRYARAGEIRRTRGPTAHNLRPGVWLAFGREGTGVRTFFSGQTSIGQYEIMR